MDVSELFEYPLPELSTDIDRIEVETSGSIEGSFTVKNTGGGELKGKILSNSNMVKFTPAEFSSKKTAIFYTIDVSVLQPGDIIRTSAVIMSNGGEKIIPVVFKMLPFCIETEGDTEESAKITCLEDFCGYANKHSESAMRMFVSADFSHWLTATAYPHMAAYEALSRDTNRKRGMDNFLILNKLKKQAVITPVEKDIFVTVNPYKSEAEAGGITFARSSWGYGEISIKKEKGVKWLTLDKEKLTTEDFDESDTATIGYLIEPRFLTEKTDCEFIIAGENGRIPVYVKSRPPLSAATQKESYLQNEKGHVLITNNTGKDLLVEIAVSENYLRFEGARYFVGAFAKIPFDVKTAGFQYSFKRRPALTAEITVSAPEYAYKKKLDVQVKL